VVSSPATPSQPHRSVRRTASSGSILLAAVLLLALLGVAPAGAQPAPPENTADAAARLQEVQLEAEALTEQWHAAKDDLAARQGELDLLRAAVETTRAAVDAAGVEEERFREQADAVALSTFESGNLDQFNALLASGSPQDFLDQMSALETLSADHRDALAELLVVVDATTLAQGEADAAAARAQSAADDAARAEQEISARRKDADVRIDEAERLLDQLTPQERRSRQGPEEDAPSGPVTGTGVGVEALEAARTQLGKAYEWGAEGPDRFDCSGLTSWAFKEAGVTLPRSSSQQARVGRSVSWDDLQAGDLVFYYSPVSHVGIYAGEGKMIGAPQTGDVVKYQTVSRKAFTSARRL